MSENNNTNCEFGGYRVETIFCGQCRYHTLLLKGGKREAFILEEGITSDKGNNNREKWAQVLSEIYAEGKKEGENNWHAGAERERKRRYDEAIAMEKELEKREKRGEECLDEPCEQAQKWANRGVMTDMLARAREKEQKAETLKSYFEKKHLEEFCERAQAEEKLAEANRESAKLREKIKKLEEELNEYRCN